MSELIQQLDTTDGGFHWWHGQTDPKRLILLSDYLIQSVQGVTDSLLNAALACEDHRSALHADNHWVVTRGEAVAKANPSASNDDHLAALRRDVHEEARDRRIAMTTDACVIYLVQCLDRCAAMAAIVGALSLDVLKVGWGDIQGLNQPGALTPKKKIARPLNALPGPDGIAVQSGLVAQFGRWPEFGPEGWLKWLLQTRNSRAHRAQPTSWSLLTVSRGRVTGLCRPLYSRPELSEMQSMAALRPGTRDLSGHLLLEESTDVLQGLVSATTELAAHLVKESRAVWDRRRNEPGLLIQPGSQWKLDGAESAEFDGFGTRVNLQKDARLHVHPTLERRLVAAKVMDDDSDFWV